MAAVSDKYSKTPAQVALKWMLRKGMSAIFGSTREDHMPENSNMSEFSISEEDMIFIDSLNEDYRIWTSPEV